MTDSSPNTSGQTSPSSSEDSALEDSALEGSALERSAAETFNHCPSCGVPVKTVGANPFVCENADCDFRFYFSPTAAVGAIIVNPDNEVLFLIRGRNPGKGKLGLPGGFVDPQETLEAALQREVLEEAALDVIGIEYLCSFPNSYTYRGVTVDVIDAFFVCEVATLEGLTPQAGEVEGFWIAKPTPEVLADLAFESNRLAVARFVNQKL